MSGSSSLDSFRDERQVAVELVPLWRVAARTCSILLATLKSSFFSSRFVSVQVVHPYSSIDTTTAWKKLCFILSVINHLFSGGARGLVVIVVGIGHSDTSSNPGGD